MAPPQELYDRPVNIFVGGFIGSPAMNLLEARIERDPSGLVAVVAGTRLPVDQAHRAVAALAAFEDEDIVLGVRPRGARDAALADEALPRLQGRVELCEALGPEKLVHFSVQARHPRTEDIASWRRTRRRARRRAAAEAGGREQRNRGGRFSPDTRAAEGEAVEVAVDPHSLHFFEPGTGRAMGL